MTNRCFWVVVLEKILESPLDCKEIKPLNPKGNQPWIFIGKTDAEAPICWLLEAKSWFIGKDPDAGKDWRQAEQGVIKDEVASWHHRLNGHEFEQTSGDSEGQGSLGCWSSQGCKEWLSNWTTTNLSFNLRTLVALQEQGAHFPMHPSPLPQRQEREVQGYGILLPL